MVGSECETIYGSSPVRGLGESETPGGVLISSVLNVMLDFPQLDTNAQPPSLRVLLPLKVLPALTLAGAAQR